jgi:hypothetical protein
MIFNDIMACGRLDWMKSLQLIDKVHFVEKEHLYNFGKTWGPHLILFARDI